MNAEAFTYTVRTIPMLDTGIGQSMGYEDDKAFIAGVEAERATYPPVLREALEEYDRRLDRAILGTA